MPPTRGRLEGRITIPTGGWTGTIDDSNVAGAAAFSVAAGTYYLSSAGGAGFSLIAALETALNTATPTDTITVALSAGEAGTGKVTITSTGTAAIVWTSTALRDVLGFVGNLAAGTTWTGTYQARNLWLPNCPYKAMNGVGLWRGWRESDCRSVENAAGYVFAHMGQQKEVNALSWNSVARSLVWEANEATEGASWERFAQDAIWGVASWGTPGGPIRFHPDANDSAVWVTYKVPGFNDIKTEPLIEDYAGGTWRVVLPRLVVDPTDTSGTPRESIVVTSLLASGSTTGTTSPVTASVSVAEDSLVLLGILSHGTGAGNSIPTAATGAGLTFTQVDAGQCLNFSGGVAYKNVTLWRAYATSAASEAITITLDASATRSAWAIINVTGVSSAGSNGAGAIAQYKTTVSALDGTATATFDAAISHPNNVNVAMNGFSTSSAGSYTAASGFTKLAIAEPVSGSAISGSFAYKTNALAATAYVGNLYHAIISVELVAANQ